jgi:UPF0716 family protein affecting phage T7 exclusion
MDPTPDSLIESGMESLRAIATGTSAERQAWRYSGAEPGRSMLVIVLGLVATLLVL